MTRKNQLRRSGTRLQQQGALWVRQTRGAGETFFGESRAASTTFARDVTAASNKLVGEWTRSTVALRKALAKEAFDWQKLVLQTRDGYVAAVKQRIAGLEAQAASTAEALTPEAVETTVLESTRDLLAKAQTTVDHRLDKGAQPKKAAPKAKPRKVKAAKATKPAKAQAKAADTPIRNYDQLSAKDVVARVQRLSGPQATAVLDYERSRKKRATVIRAVEKRLAAAS
jgi:BMFP domain-containing protein YqiC